MSEKLSEETKKNLDFQTNNHSGQNPVRMICLHKKKPTLTYTPQTIRTQDVIWYLFVKNIRIPVNFDMNFNLEWVGNEFETATKVKQS